MPTVIDSLMIELGLDASKFDAAQKKSVEQLRKFDTANAKSAKESQIGSEKMADGFLKVKGALLGFAAAAVGVSGFKDFINQQVFGNAQLGRTSRLLNISAHDIKTWGGVWKEMGGSTGGFTSFMQTMQGGMAQLKLTGDSPLVTPLSRLGLFSEAMKTGTVDVYHLSSALVDYKNKHSTQEAFSLASQLGLDQSGYELLLKGPAALHKIFDAQSKITALNQKNADAAEHLTEQWAILTQAADSLGTSLFTKLTPGMDSFTDAMVKNMGVTSKWLSNGDKNDSFWHEFLWSNGVEGKKNRVTLTPEAQARVDAGATKNVPNIGKNLPRNMRNNNPGNIEYGPFAQAHGATGSDGRFAIFPSMAVGAAAQAALLARYKAQGIDTISGVVSKWSPSGDNGAANTNAYIADVARRTGIDPNQPLQGAQWASVQSAMASHEGMTGAKLATSGAGGGNSSQVETNIGTINVHTQATDANGVAKSMRQSLQQNALISGGTIGNS